MLKNQQVNLTVTGLTHEGSGVGRVEGMAVFVPRTAPGDEITAKILKVRSGYAYGRMESLDKPSPYRVANDCPVFSLCGGCALRHIDYQAELAAKEGWVRENLTRIGKVSPDWEPILPSPETDRYRNKAQYPVRMAAGRVRTGFFSPHSHRLVPVEDCLLQPAFFADICRTVCAFCEEKGIPPYDEERHTGLLRHIHIRYGEDSRQTLVCLVINGRELPFAEALASRLEAVCPGALSFHVNRNREKTNVIFGRHTRHISGPPAVEDSLGGVRLRLSPESFYQVNRKAAELLYQAALDYADPRPEDALLDLYCGAGAVGLSMAARVGKVIGVEISPAAVGDAQKNAHANRAGNAEFICADAAAAARELAERGLKPDIAVLDPPRKGVDAGTLAHLAGMGPEKIVYLSCNSATLARDCAILAELGYRAVKGRAVDLFPRAAHVECAMLLIRAE